MGKFFYRPVDIRSRNKMIEFLRGHFRYHTMNSWNRSTSYANKVKVHSLGLTSAQVRKAYDLLDVEETHRLLNDIIRAWNEERDYQWQAGFNGRSAGYLVLYRGGRKLSDYKSWCSRCGQGNCCRIIPTKDAKRAPKGTLALKRHDDYLRWTVYQNNALWTTDVYVASYRELCASLSQDQMRQIIDEVREDIRKNGRVTLDKVCGRCGAHARHNRLRYETFSQPGLSTDGDGEFEEMDIATLRERVKLVQSFDRLCDDLRDAFIGLCNTCDVQEVTVQQPVKVKRLVPAH